jgi:hypothetical protein
MNDLNKGKAQTQSGDQDEDTTNHKLSLKLFSEPYIHYVSTRLELVQAFKQGPIKVEK